MIKVYSKINLGLDITLPKDDVIGKHKICSLFVLYKNLYDELDISVSSDNKDNVIYYKNKNSYKYTDCLIIKTLQYLRDQKLINKYYNVHVYKNIPEQSGLGGASADAAGVIKQLYANYLQLDMLDIATKLGSDIPFFLFDYQSAIVSEFGNVVEPTSYSTTLNIKVHLTEHKFSTKEVFACFGELKKIPSNKNDFYKIISDLSNNNSALNAHNSLLTSAKILNPKWATLYDELASKNDFVVMSGSGGSIVSINKTQKIRTRYAPSPTGYFHIGGARTAIFNYLFAKHFQGDFIVRIEDTDTSRGVENGIESQLDNLEWLNVSCDESIRHGGKYGPYIQTQKLERYQQLANKLLAEGKAYYCFCDEEKLEKDRQEALAKHQTPRYARTCLNYSQQEVENLLSQNIPKTIRLKIDDNKEYKWNDLIRGEIKVPGTAMTDPVILKSNNIPMYNFAVVVDDYDMMISHVLRGEEHISNTPYQIAIKEALQFDNEIEYGHLSVIVDETGKKLSKRNKDMKQFIEDYKLMGFIPEAIFNFLGLLSWSSPNNQEILSQKEFIELFDINRLSKSPTFFDYKKMLWIGNEYFKKMSNEDYVNFVKPFIKLPLSLFLKEHLDELVLLFKNQISYAAELNDLISEQFINNSLTLTAETENILANNYDVIKALQSELSKIKIWNIDSINNAINNVKSITNKKGKDLFMPIRIAATGLMHGPEIAKVLYFVQLETILDNIGRILK